MLDTRETERDFSFYKNDLDVNWGLLHFEI